MASNLIFQFSLKANGILSTSFMYKLFIIILLFQASQLHQIHDIVTDWAAIPASLTSLLFVVIDFFFIQAFPVYSLLTAEDQSSFHAWSSIRNCSHSKMDLLYLYSLFFSYNCTQGHTLIYLFHIDCWNISP